MNTPVRGVSRVALVSMACGVFLSAGPAVDARPRIARLVVQIQDTVGDANFLNAQGIGSAYGVPFVGNHVTPVDASDAGDITRVWFDHNDRHLIVNIGTEAALSPTTGNIQFGMFANFDPYWNWSNLQIWASFEGSQSKGAYVFAACNEDVFLATASTRKTVSGAGLTRIFVPRADCPGSLTQGATISGPQAFSSLWAISPDRPNGSAMDTTVRGSDYELTD